VELNSSSGFTSKFVTKGVSIMNRIRQASLAVAAVLLVGAPAAFADAPGDAWAAAKGVLPASPMVVGGLNVATIRDSQLFKQLYPQLIASSPDAKEGVETINAACGLDVKSVVQGIVFAVDESNQGIVLFSLKGIDQAKVLSCMNAAGKKENHTFTAGKADAKGIVEYTSSASKDKMYVAYLPKGVVAMATEPKDKSLLEKWLGGRGDDGKSAAGVALGKVNTGAALWAVYGKAQQLEPQMNMKAGYGHADIAAGEIRVDGRMVLANAKEATDAAAKANTEFEKAKAGGQIPPAFAGVAKSIKIQSAGDEVQIRASMPEKEALSLIGMAMGGGGPPPPAPAPAK
jgi:hypothetical protein